jgi:methionyl aminopeptidase
MLKRNLNIKLKSREEIDIMREAGRISALALKTAGEAIEPGISTKELDDIARKCIESNGAKPSFLGEDGFPATACISVNEELIHCIPSSEKIIKEGDIVSIDVGACINGFHGDNTKTFACGKISENAKILLDVTEKSLQKGIENAKVGNHIGDIGHSIQSFVEAFGFSVIKNYVGHGIGRSVHEAPSVPNYGKKFSGPIIEDGLVIAIEPMVSIGSPELEALLDGGWNVVTKDRSLCAHFEHTVAITENGTFILTLA